MLDLFGIWMKPVYTSAFSSEIASLWDDVFVNDENKKMQKFENTFFGIVMWMRKTEAFINIDAVVLLSSLITLMSVCA